MYQPNSVKTLLLMRQPHSDDEEDPSAKKEETTPSAYQLQLLEECKTVTNAPASRPGSSNVVIR